MLRDNWSGVGGAQCTGKRTCAQSCIYVSSATFSCHRDRHHFVSTASGAQTVHKPSCALYMNAALSISGGSPTQGTSVTVWSAHRKEILQPSRSSEMQRGKVKSTDNDVSCFFKEAPLRRMLRPWGTLGRSSPAPNVACWKCPWIRMHGTLWPNLHDLLTDNPDDPV